MFPINWLKQLSIPFLLRSRAARHSRQGRYALRRPSFRPYLETLEERLAPSASLLQLGEASLPKGEALLHQSSNPCVQKGYDIPAAEIGLQVMFTGFASANLSLARAGIQLAERGLAAYWSDSVKCGLQDLEQLLFPAAHASSIGINSFVVSPSNPGPGQDITATANISGAPPNTPVTLSVSGTDGYSDSNTTDITGSGIASLSIPGGAAGATDTITLSVPGLPSQVGTVTY